jgi:hypothetical protein
MDVKPHPLYGSAGHGDVVGYMDVKPDPVGFALASQLAKGDKLYDVAGGGAIGQSLADTLNAHDLYADTSLPRSTRYALSVDSNTLSRPQHLGTWTLRFNSSSGRTKPKTPST